MWFLFYPANENKQPAVGSASTHPVVFIAETHKTGDNVVALNPAQMDHGVITVSTVAILPVLCWAET
jgi:hypothetical protein